MDGSFISIDGSLGEGGGQVLRTSLALSLLTRKPVHLYNIRLKRKKPGLQPQHLKSVQAAAEICRAEVDGAALHSLELLFQPGETQPGRYRWDIGTAGSTSLVLQTVYLPLSLAGGKSTLTIIGGTHVPYSPIHPYLEGQWLPTVRETGLRIELMMEQAGFYPRGGGLIRVEISPAEALAPLEILERGQLRRIEGLSGVANLDEEIAHRQKLQALRRLEPHWRETKIRMVDLPSPGKGTFLSLKAEFEHSSCTYTALGELGKRAERVADEAVDALETFFHTGGAIDQYLADQLLLPLAFASGPSRLHTSQVTLHLLTNAEVIRKFLQCKIHIEGEVGGPGVVELIL